MNRLKSAFWLVAGMAAGTLVGAAQEFRPASAPVETLVPVAMAQEYCEREYLKAVECFGEEESADRAASNGECVAEVQHGMLPSEVLALTERLGEACEDFAGGLIGSELCPEG